MYTFFYRIAAELVVNLVDMLCMKKEVVCVWTVRYGLCI